MTSHYTYAHFFSTIVTSAPQSRSTRATIHPFIHSFIHSSIHSFMLYLPDSDARACSFSLQELPASRPLFLSFFICSSLTPLALGSRCTLDIHTLSIRVYGCIYISQTESRSLASRGDFVSAAVAAAYILLVFLNVNINSSLQLSLSLYIYIYIYIHLHTYFFCQTNTHAQRQAVPKTNNQAHNVYNVHIYFVFFLKIGTGNHSWWAD